MQNTDLVKTMLEAAVHFGHKTEKWCPKMKKYIHGQREGIHIIDLFKTEKLLSSALEFVKKEIKAGKTLLLVSTKQQAQKFIEGVANETALPYISQKWIGGFLTNFDTIKRRIKYFNDLKEAEKNGELEKYTKKEALNLKKKLEKLQIMLGGVCNLKKLPDLIFVLDSVRDKIAIKEANKMKIPVIAICDTNSDPTSVDYPIPGNDDALKSIEFFTGVLKNAILSARKD